MKDAELDRISSLPCLVTEHILSHLPIKDAVRTSVLSKEWSNKWCTLPNLVFDERCVSASTSKDHSILNDKFKRIVDHVLLLHYGPINKFKICNNYYNLVGVSACLATDIDRWILHLIGKSIEELAINIRYFFVKQHYKIPSRLFSCQSLQYLELHYCHLTPPTTFKGFRNLKSLYLDKVKMTEDDFENLISSSPLLEKLILTCHEGFKQINIHGPNLKVFGFLGDFECINFHNTFKLSMLIVYLYPGRIQGRFDECSSNLLHFFVHLPHIETLEINHSFLKYLATGVVPLNLPAPCINLRSCNDRNMSSTRPNLYESLSWILDPSSLLVSHLLSRMF